MGLTVEQMEYLKRNGISEPTEQTLALISQASELNPRAITKLCHSGWMWVELATVTGRTVKELQNAF